MRKLAIITDTASDLKLEQIERYDIRMMHFQIVYKDRTYKDQIEIDSKKVIEDLETEIPTTSLPSLEEMHSIFKTLEDEGYTDVMVVTISSGLSGCFNAVNMVKDDYKALNTVVFDSRTLSVAQAALVIKARELADEGLAVDEIVKALELMRSKQHTFFIVDTLKYLIHGGRIGRVSGTVGQLLNLKPIITIGDDGKYETLSKIRGRNKAVHYFVEEVIKLIHSKEKVKLYFSQAKGEDIKDKIIEDIKAQIPSIEIMMDTWISPVACVHCGPGYVGMLVQEE